MHMRTFIYKHTHQIRSLVINMIRSNNNNTHFYPLYLFCSPFHHTVSLPHLSHLYSSLSPFSSSSSSSTSSFYSDDAPKKDKVDDGAEKAKALEESKRKKVNLIDAKRGQNAGIALARIKVGFTEVRER